jgi:hypothetical protein
MMLPAAAGLWSLSQRVCASARSRVGLIASLLLTPRQMAAASTGGPAAAPPIAPPLPGTRLHHSLRAAAAVAASCNVGPLSQRLARRNARGPRGFEGWQVSARAAIA